MTNCYQLVCIAVLAVAGCSKPNNPPAAQQQPGYEALAAADDAAAEERAARAHLTMSMTDEQILRAIGADRTSLKLKPALADYGGGALTKTAYTNETTDVEISRTTGSLLVYQLAPADQQKRWLVKDHKP